MSTASRTSAATSGRTRIRGVKAPPFVQHSENCRSLLPLGPRGQGASLRPDGMNVGPRYRSSMRWRYSGSVRSFSRCSCVFFWRCSLSFLSVSGFNGRRRAISKAQTDTSAGKSGAAAMFAGLPRPVPVRQAKATYFDGSVGLGSWTEEAAKCIAVAAKNGELPVHVFGNPYAYNKGVGELETMIVPTEVLRRIVPSRGGFPDHPRVPLRAVGMDRRLFASLNTGVLMVAEDAFSGWYRKEKAKGKWASQPSKLKKLGRPSKQPEFLDKEIIEILAEKKISAAALHRRLVKDGRSPISVDTIRRRVKRLYLKRVTKASNRHEPEYLKPSKIMTNSSHSPTASWGNTKASCRRQLWSICQKRNFRRCGSYRDGAAPSVRFSRCQTRRLSCEYARSAQRDGRSHRGECR